MQESFAIDGIMVEGWFQDDSSIYILCTLFLLLLHQLYSDHQPLDPKDWGPLV